MLIPGIILSIIGFALLLFIVLLDDDKAFLGFLGFLGVVIYTAGLFFLFTFLSTKETAIKCHKGNNPYKQQIVYELQDSIQVPIDTIYVLK